MGGSVGRRRARVYTLAFRACKVLGTARGQCCLPQRQASGCTGKGVRPGPNRQRPKHSRPACRFLAVHVLEMASQQVLFAVADGGTGCACGSCGRQRTHCIARHMRCGHTCGRDAVSDWMCWVDEVGLGWLGWAGLGNAFWSICVDGAGHRDVDLLCTSVCICACCAEGAAAFVVHHTPVTPPPPHMHSHSHPHTNPSTVDVVGQAGLGWAGQPLVFRKCQCRQTQAGGLGSYICYLQV